MAGDVCRKSSLLFRKKTENWAKATGNKKWSGNKKRRKKIKGEKYSLYIEQPKGPQD